MTLSIALTGGIGVGKSTAAKFFEELNVLTIHLDRISRQIVNEDISLLNKIKDKFIHDNIVSDDNKLDRRKLRDIIFNNLEHKTWLEELLHPLILEKTKELINNCNDDYCIVEIPLLINKDFIALFDKILLIDCSTLLQVQRAMTRDNSTESQVNKIIDTQLPREHLQKISHDTILNEGDVGELKNKVMSYHNYISNIAKQ